MQEENGIIKNFGNNKFNAMEDGDVTNEWEEIADSERGIFEGTAEQEAQLNRQEIVDKFIG